ncbi:hypothetical protein ACP70R_039882 [Stipagrostis hirtigluma subsp. patula]
MDVLDSIEELSDEEKAMATNVFKCEVNREIFINFKKPTVRLIWLKAEIAPKWVVSSEGRYKTSKSALFCGSLVPCLLH